MGDATAAHACPIEGSFVGSGSGKKLATYEWPCSRAGAKASRHRGCVVSLHGHAVHTRFEFLLPTEDGGIHEQYEGSWIHMLNAAGYSFHGFDLVGHGRSEYIDGMQCYFKRFDDLANDSLDFVRLVKAQQCEKGEELPVFLLGESLGGGIAVRCATLDPDVCSGLVLTAPMLTLEKLARKGCNPYLRPFASLLSRITPGAQMAAVERNTKFPLRQLEMDRDPENYSGKGKLTRVRVAAEVHIDT